MALDLEQAEQLVHARRDGQLLRRDAVDAALDEHLAEPLLHGAPVALELVLGRHLLRPQPVADLLRGRAEGRLERVAEAVRGVGRHHDRLEARRGAPARGRGGDGRLADAALAGVEDRARGHTEAPKSSFGNCGPRPGHPRTT
jgi:hypothetical protein